MERGGLEARQLLKVCLFPHLTKKVLNVDFKPAVLEMSLLTLRSADGREVSSCLPSSHCPAVRVGFLKSSVVREFIFEELRIEENTCKYVDRLED